MPGIDKFWKDWMGDLSLSHVPHVCRWEPIKAIFYPDAFEVERTTLEQFGKTVVTLRCPYCWDLTERILTGHLVEEVKAVPKDGAGPAASPEAK